MCLALVKPAGKTLNIKDLRAAHAANPDGCGFAARQDGQVHVKRGLWTFEQFMQQFEPFMQAEALVHFRWATHGTVSKANTHPFVVNRQYALIHNGILQGYGHGTQSDTAHWCATVLEPLLRTYPDALQTTEIIRLLEDAIGASKMALLGSTGEPIILNEHLGVWQKGVWYSNLNFRQGMPLTSPRRAAQGELALVNGRKYFR